jgi:hypothetical protein
LADAGNLAWGLGINLCRAVPKMSAMAALACSSVMAVACAKLNSGAWNFSKPVAHPASIAAAMDSKSFMGRNSRVRAARSKNQNDYLPSNRRDNAGPHWKDSPC